MGAALGSRAKSLGVGLDVSRKRDRYHARTAELRERLESHPIPPGRDDTRGAESKREEHGRGSICAGRSGDDDRFARGETPARQASVGYRKSRQNGKLSRAELAQAIDRRHARLRDMRIFGEVPSRQSA